MEPIRGLVGECRCDEQCMYHKVVPYTVVAYFPYISRICFTSVFKLLRSRVGMDTAP